MQERVTFRPLCCTITLNDLFSAESAIRKAADELGSAIGDAAVGKAKLHGEIAPILTDEQRALIKKFHAEQRKSVEELLAEWTEDK